MYNKQAATELLKRAFSTSTPSLAGLLIDSAVRLDPTIDAEEAKSTWLELWLEETKQERENG